MKLSKKALLAKIKKAKKMDEPNAAQPEEINNVDVPMPAEISGEEAPNEDVVEEPTEQTETDEVKSVEPGSECPTCVGHAGLSADRNSLCSDCGGSGVLGE